ATHVEQALERADPAHISSYQQALAAYTAKLTQLDADIKSKINSLTNKKLVTNHDALGYYVERYGLEFVGSIIPSFDTSAELSAATWLSRTCRSPFMRVRPSLSSAPTVRASPRC